MGSASVCTMCSQCGGQRWTGHGAHQYGFGKRVYNVLAVWRPALDRTRSSPVWVRQACVQCARSVEASNGQAVLDAQTGKHAFRRTPTLILGRWSAFLTLRQWPAT